MSISQSQQQGRGKTLRKELYQEETTGSGRLHTRKPVKEKEHGRGGSARGKSAKSEAMGSRNTQEESLPMSNRVGTHTHIHTYTGSKPGRKVSQGEAKSGHTHRKEVSQGDATGLGYKRTHTGSK